MQPDCSSWAAGTRLLVKYASYDFWHERMLLAPINAFNGHWVIATPDYDVHHEELQVGATFEQILAMPRDRSLPRGVLLFYSGRTADGDISLAECRELIAKG